MPSFQFKDINISSLEGKLARYLLVRLCMTNEYRSIKPNEILKGAIRDLNCEGIEVGEIDMGLNKAAVAMGKIGGSKKSEAKSTASRANGKLGGRPRKVKDA